MPTYDLTCKDCGERFELFVTRLLRESDRVCRRCGSMRVDTGVGGGFLGGVGRSTVPQGGGCSPGAFT